MKNRSKHSHFAHDKLFALVYGCFHELVNNSGMQNLVIAMGAMLALSLPTLWGAIPLSLAVGLHEASTLLVALNSLRLLYRKDHLAAA